MAYVDIATLQTIATGQPFQAATLQQIRDNQEFFVDPPACSVYASSAQSVSNNSLTGLTADSENYDNDSMHSTSSNPQRITIQTAGRYLVSATVSFALNSSGIRFVEFFVNDSTRHFGQTIVPSTSDGMQVTATRTLVLNVGDYVSVRVRQTSGGSLVVELLEFVALFQTR